MSHPIALPACQLLGPTFPYHYISAVCSRRPAACGFASESHLRSRGEISGLPVARPAEHAPGRANLECRCRVLHAASQYRRSTCKTPSDRSLRGERRRSDGTATTLPSSRADLAVFRCCFCVWSVHASLGLCRSLLPLALDLEKSSNMVGARHQAGIGRGSVWACCVRRKFSPNSAYSHGNRASGCSHRTSQHRAASAGLSATAGACKAACSLCHAYWMHASRRQQQACVWNAASGGM